MRRLFAALMVLSCLSASALGENTADQGLCWTTWRSLPVQDRSRQKPLDTLAWETLRTISNRAGFSDPETDRRLDAAGLYLSMLFDWQGWESSASPQTPASPHGGMGARGAMCADPRAAYFRGHKADKWDRAPLILVESLELRAALGMAPDQKHISPQDLTQAEIEEPGSQTKARFTAFVQRLSCRPTAGSTPFEKAAMEVANRLWAYQDHRMGKRMEIVPLKDSENRQWASVAMLLQGKFDDRNDPGGELRRVKDQLQKVRAAYRAGSSEAFQEASANFFATLREIGSELGDYPPQRTIDLEVAFNHWVPFRFAWILTLIASLAVLLSMGTGWKSFYAAAVIALAASIVAMLIGFGMRVAISGRAPVTNMYESVVYVGMGVALLGLILEMVYRRQFVLLAAGAVSTVALILADNCPVILDPDLQPLKAILRSNFWLVIHVMSITLSYAAFALALGIGNITLGYCLAGSKDRDTIEALSKFTYRTLQVGVALLAIGTVTGGIWADYAWGRFWGWDPKEVWALIALLGYLAVLHARYVGWVRSRGLAALSVACFALVVTAWYGVNFLGGAGLHSYGFSGDGGQTYVAAVLLVQLLYVAVAMARPVLAEAGSQPSPKS